MWNITDDLILYSYNISIDNLVSLSSPFVSLAYNNTIGSTNATVNFNYRLGATVPAGIHTLRFEFSDGHTAQALTSNYEFDYGGIFDKKLQITVDDKRDIILTSSDGEFTNVEKLSDRLSYSFKPIELKTQYNFEVYTDENLYILHNDKLDDWIVAGKNWIDFKVENQPNTNVKITKTSSKSAVVTVTNIVNPKEDEKGLIEEILNPTEIPEIKFNSVGEINTVTLNYTIYTYNVTVTDMPTMLGGNIWTSQVRFDKYNGSYGINLINRSYNNTNYFSQSGYLAQNISIWPFYELWNITYTTPAVTTTTTYITNYSWKINDYNQSILLNQTLLPLTINNCTNLTWAKAINFLMYNENYTAATGTKQVNGTVNVYLELSPSGFSGSSVNTSLSMTGGWNHSLCMFPNSSVAVGNSIIEYYAPGFTNRKFFLNNVTLSNNTLTVPLYLLQSSLSSNIQEKVYDRSTGSGIGGAYVSLLRFYPDQAAYKTVAMTLTDDLGYAVESLQPYDIYYKFLVNYNLENKLLTELQTVYTGTKLLPISLGDDSLKSLQYIGSIGTNVTCTKSTRTCEFVWSDPNGLTRTADFKVYKQNGFGKTIIYENTLDSSSGILFYTLPASENINTSTYIAEGAIHTNTKNSFYIVGRAEMRNFVGLSSWGGIDAVLYAFMLLEIVLCFIFVDLGPAGVIAMMILGMGFGTFLGMIPFTFSAIISLAIIGGLIIYKSK
jgi:hypothetical protein